MAKPGRPTAYDPSFCDEIIETMGEGYSVAGFAGKIGVARSSIYEWAKVHPEFSDALNQARAAAALWWEERALDLAKGKDGNASVVIFGLKNRVADEWRDVNRTEHTGPDGQGIVFQTIIET